MARKPATKSDDHKDGATAASTTGEAKSASAAPDDVNTKGGDTTGALPVAPDAAPHMQPQGQTGGEDTGLSANSDEVAALAAAVADLKDEPAPLVPVPMALTVDPDAAWVVVCHREGGRRRAGRRWPAGETPVKDGDLTDYQLALLQGDPQFTVRAIERD